MWTFTRDFLKKVDLDLKMWTLARQFLKNADLNLKKVDLYTSFSEKSGPLPEKQHFADPVFYYTFCLIVVISGRADPISY